jgi:hypothetical protein
VDSQDRAVSRRRALERLEHDPAVVAEVLAYCESPFVHLQHDPPVFPLPAEPHVEDWRRYSREAGTDLFGYLQDRLPQLAVPVRDGVSKTEAYGAVARRGQPFRLQDFGGRLQLVRPEALRLHLHEHPAGALPVLSTGDRRDFEALVRAFAHRSEPVPIGPAVNAHIVAGFVNWDRVARYREAWAAGRDPASARTEWPGEMARVAGSEVWRFHDRLVLACVRPYSGVTAADLGLPMGEEEWLNRSTDLRVEHEFTHYATKRLFGAMANRLFDETIADVMGMTRALGTFHADWFLRFLGLEAWPDVRDRGRIRTYTAGLSDAGFRLVCEVTVQAARGAEAVVRDCYTACERGRFLLAMSSLTLDLLASPDIRILFGDAYATAGRMTASAPA